MHDQRLYDRIIARTVKDPATGCWNWTGPRRNGQYEANNYGHIAFKRPGRQRSMSVNCHRAMWIALNGEIETQVYICHRCDNPLCVNPAHLFAGSAKDNTHDMLAKKRHNNSRKTICKQGHPLEGDNVYVAKGGIRHCKACGRMRQRERYLRDPEKMRRQARERRSKQVQLSDVQA